MNIEGTKPNTNRRAPHSPNALRQDCCSVLHHTARSQESCPDVTSPRSVYWLSSLGRRAAAGKAQFHHFGSLPDLVSFKARLPENCKDSGLPHNGCLQQPQSFYLQPFLSVDGSRLPPPSSERLSRATSLEGRTARWIAQFLTHVVDAQYLTVGFLLDPNLRVPVNLPLVSLLTAGTETSQSVTHYGLFLDLWINLIVHISLSGDRNRPLHLCARSNQRLKEEEDMGAPTECRHFQGRKYPIIIPARVR